MSKPAKCSFLPFFPLHANSGSGKFPNLVDNSPPPGFRLRGGGIIRWEEYNIDLANRTLAEVHGFWTTPQSPRGLPLHGRQEHKELCRYFVFISQQHGQTTMNVGFVVVSVHPPSRPVEWFPLNQVPVQILTEFFSICKL